MLLYYSPNNLVAFYEKKNYLTCKYDSSSKVYYSVLKMEKYYNFYGYNYKNTSKAKIKVWNLNKIIFCIFLKMHFFKRNNWPALTNYKNIFGQLKIPLARIIVLYFIESLRYGVCVCSFRKGHRHLKIGKIVYSILKG